MQLREHLVTAEAILESYALEQTSSIDIPVNSVMRVRISREEPNCDAMTESGSESFDSRETMKCAAFLVSIKSPFERKWIGTASERPIANSESSDGYKLAPSEEC
jgi:hypothetical protein